MRGLYAIVDVGLLSARAVDVVAFAKAVLQARPAALQLRAKDLPAREQLTLLRALLPICRYAEVPLVVNDRADVAALAGSDLVHIGQTDIALERVRRIAPTLGIGVSTHDPVQLARALEQRPRYVAYGPVYATTTKHNPDPVVGLAGLASAYAASARAGVPLVAIGGINEERAFEVAPYCDAAAVISGLLPRARPGAQGGLDDFELAEVTRRAQRIHAALLGESAGAEARE